MSDKEKSIKRKLINAAARLTDYLMINYLVSWIKYRRYPNAVFIKIPKTAGTSLIESLPAPKLKKIRFIKYRFIQKGIVTFGHMSYLDIRNEGLVSDKFHESAYFFTFVRNPYDRAVSLYHHLIKVNRFTSETSFLEFCRMISQRDIEPIGLYAVRGYSQCNPQVTWTRDIDIDFIGRFENLEQDYEVIKERLGIRAEKLGHFRKSSRKHYSDYYCQESANVIRQLYAEDFKVFGYDPDEIYPESLESLSLGK